MRTFAIVGLLAAGLLFLTLTGGGLFPATAGIVALTLSLASVVLLLKRTPAADDAVAARPGERPHLEWLIVALLLTVAATTIPLPPALDLLAGPLRHHQNEAVTAAFSQAAEAGIPTPDAAPWFALSRNRAGTFRYLMLLAASFSATLLASLLPTTGRMTCLLMLAGLGGMVGLAGHVAQWHIPQGDTLWWYLPVPHSFNQPVGCFLNRNHFAGFVALLTPAAWSLAWHGLRSRRWIVGLVLAAWGAGMTAVVVYSLSRGATLALFASLATCALLLTYQHHRRWGLFLLVVLLLSSGLVAARSTTVRERVMDLGNDSGSGSVNSRLAEWRESLRVWPSYPLFGAGMNALRMVYPQHRQTSVGARLVHAENEYIQWLVEGGVVGVLLLVLLGVAAWRRMRSTAGSLPRPLLLAVTGGVVVLAVHGAFDFPARLPLYMVAAGVLVGLVLPAPARPRNALLPAGTILLLAGMVLLGQPARIKNLDDPNYLQGARYRELQQALVWAPTSTAWLYLGHGMYREGQTRLTPELASVGIQFITRSAQLDPQNYRLWYELGETRLTVGDRTGALEAFTHAKKLRAWLTIPPMPGPGGTP